MGKYDKDIINTYIPLKTSLRDVARICNTDHHTIKRVLLKYHIPIVPAKKRPFTQEHKDKISKANIGKVSANKGKTISVLVKYKNIRTKFRHLCPLDWWCKHDYDKCKVLRIMCKRIEFKSSEDFMFYLDKFYNDETFNKVYDNWIRNNRKKIFKPSLDHIKPTSVYPELKDDVNNLQVLTWFENKCKSNHSVEEWDYIKNNLDLLFK